MWLDGVYLLPLSLLGVYLITQQNSRGLYLLAVTIGLGLIFNWYVGTIKQQSDHVKAKVVNGKDSFEVENVHANNYLQTTIPYESGWQIRLNGKEVTPKLLDDTLMALSLEKGRNTITMEYHVVHLKLGALLTLIGVILLISTWYLTRKGSQGRK